MLALADPEGRPHHLEVDLPLPTASAGAAVETMELPWLTPAATSSAAPAVPLLHALLLALLGGLVLNLMPCVLPVLAIKVFSISEMAHAAHVGRGEPIRHGVAYTAGILGSMAVLGTSVVALRAAGHSVGWGFQFQEPIYVAAICAVLVAFALNLFGVFEIQVGVGALGNLGPAGHRSETELLRGPAGGGPRDAVLGALPGHRHRLRVRQRAERDPGDLPRGRGSAWRRPSRS